MMLWSRSKAKAMRHFKVDPVLKIDAIFPNSLVLYKCVWPIYGHIDFCFYTSWTGLYFFILEQGCVLLFLNRVVFYYSWTELCLLFLNRVVFYYYWTGLCFIILEQGCVLLFLNRVVFYYSWKGLCFIILEQGCVLLLLNRVVFYYSWTGLCFNILEQGCVLLFLNRVVFYYSWTGLCFIDRWPSLVKYRIVKFKDCM